MTSSKTFFHTEFHIHFVVSVLEDGLGGRSLEQATEFLMNVNPLTPNDL
jgi:hypothetical protein